MIAVIGGVKATVRLKMAPPERDIDKQKKQDEDALLAAGIDISKMEQEASGEEDSLKEDSLDARFRAYYQQKMQEQANENYWDQVGLGARDFGGYATIDSEKDSDIRVSCNGCAYNVARILGSKTDVAFVSVIGTDFLGLAAKCELEAAGADISAVKTLQGATPVSVEIVNMLGDLDFARENSLLADEITPELVDEASGILDNAEAIFVDGSVPVETMNYVSEKYAGRCPIYFDPASIQGGYAYNQSSLVAECVMPGRMEAEAMSSQQVLGLDQLMSAGEYFEGRGTARTIITLKGGGLYYKEGPDAGIIKPEQQFPSTATTKGAGDVLSAQLMLGMVEGMEFKAAAEKAVEAAVDYIREENL